MCSVSWFQVGEWETLQLRCRSSLTHGERGSAVGLGETCRCSSSDDGTSLDGADVGLL